MASSKLYYQNMYLGSNELSALYHGAERIWRVPFVPQIRRRPFMLYEPTARDFTVNGFATIHPISAIHDRNIGQAGEVSIELPVDGYGEWKQVTPNAIILAPTKWRGEYKPQAFRVYRIVKAMDESGRKTLKAYARHVFYDMMYSVLLNEVFGVQNPTLAIKHIFEHQFGFSGKDGDVLNPYFYHLASDAWYSRDGGATVKNFDSETDGQYRNFEFQSTSVVDALIGGSGSIADIYGLELYVDNFYFSLFTHVNNVMHGNVIENAFDIRYSFDMMNVSEDVDYTNAFTHLFAFDNAGLVWGISAPEEIYGPFARPKQVKFSYRDPLDYTAALDRLSADGKKYWDDNRDVTRTYTAKYAPLHLDQSRDFLGQLDGREVGDTGIVRNDSLGIVSTGQRIISKRVDLLRDITLDIKLGNAPAAITKQGAWSNTARSTPPSAVEKQIEAMQA